jgi:plastocyanin
MKPVSVLPLVAAILLVISLWGSTGVAAVRGASPAEAHAAATDSITITVSSAFAFDPSSFEVNPGDTVTLTVEQLGDVQHTFTLSSVANFSFTNSNSTADLTSFFAAHPPLAYFQINATPGEKQTVTFKAPPLGVYEYVCEVPGHFQLGMWGDMGSGVAVGPPPAPTIPVVLYVITGGIAGLVVLAVILGFVVGKREGAKHEMPPERLGYPEPKPPAPGTPLPPR